MPTTLPAQRGQSVNEKNEDPPDDEDQGILIRG